MNFESFFTGADPYNEGMDLPDGELTREDHNLLREYSKGKDIVVNLGTYKGRSAALMSYGANTVITVDCYICPDFGHDFILDTLCKKFKNIVAYQARSHEPAADFEDECIDFVFQDAGHSAGDVFADYSAWFPKLKQGGYMAFHDWKYQDGSVCPSMDVRGGVRQVLADGKCEDIGARGWCYVIRKP